MPDSVQRVYASTRARKPEPFKRHPASRCPGRCSWLRCAAALARRAAGRRSLRRSAHCTTFGPSARSPSRIQTAKTIAPAYTTCYKMFTVARACASDRKRGLRSGRSRTDETWHLIGRRPHKRAPRGTSDTAQGEAGDGCVEARSAEAERRGHASAAPCAAAAPPARVAQVPGCRDGRNGCGAA